MDRKKKEFFDKLQLTDEEVKYLERFLEIWGSFNGSRTLIDTPISNKLKAAFNTWQWIEEHDEKQREEFVRKLDDALSIGGEIERARLKYGFESTEVDVLYREFGEIKSKWGGVETCDDCGKELSEGELTECARCEQKSSERATYPI